MSEPIAPADELDEASARFGQAPTLEEVMAGAEPFAEDDSFAIRDLTDEAWAAFTRALHE